MSQTLRTREEQKTRFEKQFEAVFLELGNLVELGAKLQDGEGSALHGLQLVAFAFAALLDAYAKPNDGNPEGMCDDPIAFREYFAGLIREGSGQMKVI